MVKYSHLSYSLWQVFSSGEQGSKQKGPFTGQIKGRRYHALKKGNMDVKS